MASELAANLAAVIPSILMLAVYHWYLVHCVKTCPSRTVYGLTRAARRVWVAAIMYRKNEILAVQSLRNWVMASSFLATTSVVIITASTALLGSLAVNWNSSVPSSPVFYTIGFVLDAWFPYRFLALLIMLVAAFFMFAQSVRFFNHAALVCNVNVSQDELSTFMDPGAPGAGAGGRDPFGTLETYAYLRSNPTHVAAILNRGCFYYTSGMRCYYFCFPLLCWLWGPIPLAVSTAILVLVLRLIDFHVEEFDPAETSDADSAARWGRWIGYLKRGKGHERVSGSRESVTDMVEIRTS